MEDRKAKGGFAARRETLKTLGKAALASVVAPAGMLSPGTAFAEPVVPIRFGLQNTFTGAAAVVWSRRKIYEKRHLKVEAYKFADGRSVRDAILAGKVDFGTMNLTPFFVGAASGNFTLIAFVLLGGDTVGVFGRPGIEKISDLKGKSVSITIGSTTGAVFVHQVGPKLGLPEDSYRVINLSPENQLPALVAGSCDAFAGPEPFLTLGEQQKAGKVLTRFGPYDANPTALVVSTAFLKEHPATVHAFLLSWLDGVQYWNSNLDGAAGALLDMYHESGIKTLTPDLVRKLVTYPKVIPDITPELVTYMKGQAEILHKAGRLKKLPDWDKVVRPDLVQKARAQWKSAV